MIFFLIYESNDDTTHFKKIKDFKKIQSTPGYLCSLQRTNAAIWPKEKNLPLEKDVLKLIRRTII